MTLTAIALLAQQMANVERRLNRNLRPKASSTQKKSPDSISGMNARIGGVASIPARQASLEQMLRSVLPQLDQLHVFLNGYESVPTFLHHPKISVHQSQDHGDLSDAGKFFGLQFHDTGTYFTLDDDIEYPNDYCLRMDANLAAVNRRAIVGVHGVFFPKNTIGLTHRSAIPYRQGNEELRGVSLLGTGTSAFPVGLINLPMTLFRLPRMADVWVALEAKRLSVPLYAVPRRPQWLRDIEHGSDTIWDETRANNQQQSKLIVDARPWGLDDLATRRQPELTDRVHLRRWDKLLAVYRTIDAGDVCTLFKSETVLDQIDLAWIRFYLESATLSKVLREIPAEDWSAHSLSESAVSVLADEDPLAVLKYWKPSVSTEYSAISTEGLAVSLLKCLEVAGDGGLFKNVADELEKRFPDNPTLSSLALKAQVSSTDSEGYLTELYKRSEVLARSGEFDRHMLSQALACSNLPSAAESVLRIFLYSSSNRLKYRTIAHILDMPELGDAAQNSPLLQAVVSAFCHAPQKNYSTLYLLAALGLRSLARDALGSVSGEGQTLPNELMSDANTLRALLSESLTLALDDLNGDLALHSLEPWAEFTIDDWTSTRASLSRSTPVLAECRGSLVSIVMSCYNSADTLPAAAKSILSQTWANLELIIVDDYSQDDSLEVAHRLAESDSRISVLPLGSNCGPYACRNAGISLAKGDTIGFQDADDISHHQRIEYQIRLLSEQDAVCSYVSHVRVNERNQVVVENSGQVRGEGPVTLLMRRRVVDELGFFYEVRTRGDVEHRERLLMHYGRGLVLQDQAVLLLARYSSESNSLAESAGSGSAAIAHFKAKARAFRVLADSGSVTYVPRGVAEPIRVD